MADYCKLIRRYYLKGYGVPKRYYTDESLDLFVAKGMLAQDEAAALKAEKAGEADARV